MRRGCPARGSRAGFTELYLPGQLREAVERGGVAERLLARGLLWRGAREDLLDGHLELLAVEGLGYLGDGEDLVRYVSRRGVLLDTPLYPVLQIVVEFDTFLQDHEERHNGASPFSGDVDDEAVGHLLDLVDGGVDLARSHPYAAAVYGRVGAAVDHAGAVLFYLDPISVTPHAGIYVEVALPVTLPFLIVPEVDRHGWHGLGDDELPDLVYLGVSLLIEGLDLCPQGAGLELPRADRQERDPADERRAHVCATAGREEPQILLDVLVGPLEALGRQRRPRRADGLEVRQVEVPPRLYVRLHAGCDVARAGPETGHTCLLCELPEDVHVRMARVSIVEQNGGAGEQAGYDQVPHHPARRSEPEKAVVRPEVYVQHGLLEVLDEDAALTVHDRFRKTRRAGRVEHPERMVERHLLERELRAFVPGQELVPG